MTTSGEGRTPQDRALDGYNRPGATPREEMWAEITARLSAEEGAREGTNDLAAARARRSVASGRFAGLAVAAAAVLVLGVGIGRMTAPVGPGATADGDGSVPVVAGGTARTGLGLATREHLGQSESLLSLVRADGRDGRVDPAVAAWAEGLLLQTRLLLDRDGVSPETRELLMDLELVLAQVVNAAGSGAGDGARSDTEMALTMKTLEDGRLLSRLRVASPDELSGV